MSNTDIQRETPEVEDESIDTDVPFGRMAPPQNPSQVYSVRIPVDRLEELRRVAARRGVPPSTLLREWVLERLDNQAQPTFHRFEVRRKQDFHLEDLTLLRRPNGQFASLGVTAR
jgi:hypothetical protein